MIKLYKFYSSNCKPCEQFIPIWNNLKEEFKSLIDVFQEVNTDPDADEDDQNIVIKFSRDLRSVPALILYISDSEYYKYTWSMFDRDEIKEWINYLLDNQ